MTFLWTGRKSTDLGANLVYTKPPHRQVITGVTQERQFRCHTSASELSREVCQHMLGYEITEICCYFDQLITVSCPWNMPYFLLQPHSQEPPPTVFSDVHQAQGSDFFSNSCNYDLHVFITEQIWNLSWCQQVINQHKKAFIWNLGICQQKHCGHVLGTSLDVQTGKIYL